jgi:signal transduction histidine kinase
MDGGEKTLSEDPHDEATNLQLQRFLDRQGWIRQISDLALRAIEPQGFLDGAACLLRDGLEARAVLLFERRSSEDMTLVARCLHPSEPDPVQTDGEILHVPVSLFDRFRVCVEADAEAVAPSLPVALSPVPPQICIVPLHARDSLIGGILGWGSAHCCCHSDEDFLRDASAVLALGLERFIQDRSTRMGERLRGLGNLAGGLAHELNNLLMALRANLDVLRFRSEGMGVDEELTRIDACVDSASSLVDQILGFARMGREQRYLVSVPTVVHQALGVLEASLPRGTRVETKIHSEALVRASPALVGQVCSNLILNAVQAAGPEGTVWLELDDLELEAALPVHGGRVGPGAFARLQVHDDGPGIPEEHRERVFDPFFSTKAKGEGTGLGLPFVQGVVAAQGGGICLRSRPGGGTTATVYLPTEAEAAAEHVQPGHDARPSPAGVRVLLVDDEDLVREGVSRLLRHLGFGVIECDSAQAALDVLERDTPIDVVLTDEEMPNMRGHELAAEIKRRRRNLSVVMLLSSPGMHEELLGNRDVAAIITKPVRGELLARKLLSVVEG